ncbi:MAG: ATP-dependent Clp protease proteolytic subunit, partial [Muribaculaceae bacterium]|nr:ATP-dependent Clp protease proteolytic subunit [Muribaculaceae bacterium]
MNNNSIKETVRGIDLVPIQDVLLEESKIFLTSEINTTSASELIEQLMYLDSKNSGEITLYINSPGGEVMSGLAVYDF